MMEVGFSPCPNDTCIFYGWVSGKTKAPSPISPHYEDVQTLNELSKKGRFPLTKLSCNAFANVASDYIFLPVGAALGKGCGPLVVAKGTPDLSTVRLAIPGKETTAHLLAKAFLPEPEEKIFCLYNEVLDLIDAGKADAGVIIHETRFTYQEKGFHLLYDLGKMWEERTNAPLPLGGIAAKRDLPKKSLDAICQALFESCSYTKNHLEEAMPYILEHSEEKDLDVVKGHIDLYVNEETLHLSQEGEKAFLTLMNMAKPSTSNPLVHLWKPEFSLP